MRSHFVVLYQFIFIGQDAKDIYANLFAVNNNIFALRVFFAIEINENVKNVGMSIYPCGNNTDIVAKKRGILQDNCVRILWGNELCRR